MKIAKIFGQEIFDSRGWPTIECQIVLENGVSVYSSVPSGLSLGSFEAKEIRDEGKRLFGKGVQKAISNIENVIAPKLISREPQGLEMDLEMIEIDGTENKLNLGANAMLAVSQALYRAEALIEKLELYELIAFLMEAKTVRLPYPIFNMINGGKHADNNLSIQEFLIIPIGVTNFRASLESGIIFYHELKRFLKNKNIPTAVSDEGGFSVGFKNNEEAFDVLLTIIEKLNSEFRMTFVMAVDIAASQFYDFSSKFYKFNGNVFSSDQMIEYYSNLINKYPIYSIEDGLSEHDWEGWIKLTKLLGSKIQIVGDDIFSTNIFRISKGIEENVANSVIIKPNQIGTIMETLQAAKIAQEKGLNVIVSHRSGETEDTFIADLAVGVSAGQIKAGNCLRERIFKYNRLLNIEDQLIFSGFNS